MGKERAASNISHEAWIRHALDEFQRPLLSYVHKMLKDGAAAQDVVQDTFIKLCQQDRERVEAKLKSWLFTVARNAALDVIRKRQRQTSIDDELAQAIPSGEKSPDSVVALRETLEGVERFLERLSENQQEVVRLKFQYGLSYKEIAEATGLTVGNVGFLLHSALKRLRELMSHQMP